MAGEPSEEIKRYVDQQLDSRLNDLRRDIIESMTSQNEQILSAVHLVRQGLVSAGVVPNEQVIVISSSSDESSYNSSAINEQYHDYALIHDDIQPQEVLQAANQDQDELPDELNRLPIEARKHPKWRTLVAVVRWNALLSNVRQRNGE